MTWSAPIRAKCLRKPFGDPWNGTHQGVFCPNQPLPDVFSRLWFIISHSLDQDIWLSSQAQSVSLYKV
ncbi:uncharacterized protein LACBIDRAFT_307436 [Laccaria bicolor S238N-H82]|uniref:Predicted protein n=1 Tax=Laccaria bicolor (strain S238N-H82 / ATCC MYA-4686) TaxID=486041 RepID=B0DQ52_LACBS|nr:uncharacterized protein LACBIDRAFT_307436 [Laccaria bicolor S238N-H82]EDR03326.1 predicted protein [Laccaria bicolor S238N-H82]|eukprot:XP_001886122.1 predicted protein [Laccaria bicolor S238N-H82]